MNEFNKTICNYVNNSGVYEIEFAFYANNKNREWKRFILPFSLKSRNKSTSKHQQQ